MGEMVDKWLYHKEDMIINTAIAPVTLIIFHKEVPEIFVDLIYAAFRCLVS